MLLEFNMSKRKIFPINNIYDSSPFKISQRFLENCNKTYNSKFELNGTHNESTISDE